VPPARILLHDPRDSGAMDQVHVSRLAEWNFLGLPAAEQLRIEYGAFRAALEQLVPVTSLAELLNGDAGFAAEAENNPNLMFMRDSSVTLPWEPDLYIPARIALPSRAAEPAIAAAALERLGLRSAVQFSGAEYLEGGDVLPVMDEGRRILLVGFGVRTTEAAAVRIARELIPGHLDEIIGLSHDRNLLHLDTGFTVLPNRVMLAASGMFHSGFRIDESHAVQPIDPIVYAEGLGFTLVRVDKADAIAHERCNLLPLGDGRYLAFDMPAALRSELEERAGIRITCLAGTEIAKATGGVHCLTRPVYR